MVSPLQKAVEFFKEFGLFDVVLPFLLVFSIVFAILEKTMILGVDKIKEKEYPKRALNTTVAFVVAMFVVATNKIVMAINRALPNVVLLVVIIISFLMLVGIFYKTGEFNFAEQHKTTTGIFVAVILLVVLLIFAGSIMKTEDQSYLSYIVDYVIENFTGTIVTSIIFLIVAIAAVFYVTKGPTPSKGE